MTDEQNIPNDEGGQPTRENSWQEVGHQFQTLGESLAGAIRTAWENEENRKRVDEMRSGLVSMVDNVSQAVKDTAASPQAQQAKDEAAQAVDSFSNAFEQTAQEVRPHLVAALRQINADLQKFIDRLKEE
jgi:ABC-type transporter Mla subunit MlaD